MLEEAKAIYGLIGYPVKHSLSPLMHNAAFEALEIDAEYKLFELQRDELDDFFAELRDELSPIFGLNVTVPYKEEVVKYIDSFSPFAQKVMAVNTIVVSKDRKLIGYNTDAPGFLAHLNELNFEVCDKKVAIIGAGGASRAIVSMLCLIPDKPKIVLLYDIDKQRAERLIDDLSQRMDTSIVKAVFSIDDLDIGNSDLLINATPVGMKQSDPVLVEPELLHTDMLVYDLIYNPAETLLLKIAKQKGANIANGLGMLFYQGVLAFEHWANTRLDEKIKIKMREALEKGLEK